MWLERPLTRESFKILHKWVMKNDSNAEKGILSEGLIQGSMDNAIGDYYGEKQYEGIFKKTAVLIHSIVTFHPFVDGNKRTALLSSFFFLLFHGYVFNIVKEEVIQILIDIANGELDDIEKISDWLREHSKEFDFSERILMFFIRMIQREIDLSRLERVDLFSKIVENILEGMEEEWPE